MSDLDARALKAQLVMMEREANSWRATATAWKDRALQAEAESLKFAEVFAAAAVLRHLWLEQGGFGEHEIQRLVHAVELVVTPSAPPAGDGDAD